jgi:hypothetical protein
MQKYGYLLEFKNVDKRGMLYTYRKELYSSFNKAMHIVYNVVAVNKGLRLQEVKDVFLEDNERLFHYDLKDVDSGRKYKEYLKITKMDLL